MLRMPISPRPHLKEFAESVGFNFHTIDGNPYWIEDRYYQFSLAQIENDLEEPTNEIHQMCLAVVDDVIASEQLLRQFQIPVMH